MTGLLCFPTLANTNTLRSFAPPFRTLEGRRSSYTITLSHGGNHRVMPCRRSTQSLSARRSPAKRINGLIYKGARPDGVKMFPSSEAKQLAGSRVPWKASGFGLASKSAPGNPHTRHCIILSLLATVLKACKSARIWVLAIYARWRFARSWRTLSAYT